MSQEVPRCQKQPLLWSVQTEMERFAHLVQGQTAHWLLNIYEPGGIGKAIVGQKMQTYGQQSGIPLAFVDGIRPDLTPDRILYAIKEGLATTETLADAFSGFALFGWPHEG